MINKGCALEGPAMRSSGVATGTPSRMPACSISTTTGPTTATTMSASADPSIQRLDDGMPSVGSFLVEQIPEETPKARKIPAKPETATDPTGDVAECGYINLIKDKTMPKTKAGIALDEWKLPIFERHLSQAGYAYKQSAGLVPDSLTLTVYTENIEALAVVVKAANDEAAGKGAQQ